MTLADATAILLYYQLNPSTAPYDHRAEFAAATVVAEHAKDAIKRFNIGEPKVGGGNDLR